MLLSSWRHYPLVLQKAESALVKLTKQLCLLQCCPKPTFSQSPLAWPKFGKEGVLDKRKLMLYHSRDNDLAGIWCFDLERAFTHLAPFYLPVMASQAIWHLCLQTWGSPTARSSYFNQGFLHRPHSQLGLEYFIFLSAPLCFWLFSILLLFYWGI